MSRENVELVHRGFEAFARGDIEGVLELMDPDVDWQPAIAPILGVDAVRGIEDFGDTVLVMARYTGRGESSGIEMDQTFATVYTLRNRRTVTMRDYSTRAEALEALGLGE